MLFSALTCSRAPSALPLIQFILDAGTVLGAGTEQRKTDLVSILSSSRLVREGDSNANILLARAPSGAILREQIAKLLDTDHRHWGGILEEALPKMMGNSISYRRNSIGRSIVEGESLGHFGNPKMASVAGARLQERVQWPEVESPD